MSDIPTTTPAPPDPYPHSYWQSLRDEWLLNNGIPATYNIPMDIDSLTIGDAKKLASMFSNQPALPSIQEERAVIVCTDKRGVFFGYARDTSGETIKLRSARNAFYWSANQGGVLALASEGPRDGSKIGARADIELRGITCVISCSDVAVKAWEDAKWKQ